MIFLIHSCAFFDDEVIGFVVDLRENEIGCAVFLEHVFQECNVAEFNHRFIGDDEGFLAKLLKFACGSAKRIASGDDHPGS